MTLLDLMIAAEALSIEDRADLAHFLLMSLDEDDVSEAEEAEIRAEWIAVAQERSAEMKSGKEVGIPAEEVLRTLLDPEPIVIGADQPEDPEDRLADRISRLKRLRGGR
ncbi:MAG: addiction module protein [Planctomycetes bacterium]|nr:addiction module protein [Planctomycetota bacterium]